MEHNIQAKRVGTTINMATDNVKVEIAEKNYQKSML